MKIATLIVKNIRFYYRSWLITLAGALIGTAVLTGALITGDSVKYSLKELVAMRLGSVHYALAPSDRFFRQALAAELSSHTGSTVVPVLRTTGIVTEPNQNLVLNQAQIVGISNDFKLLWEKSANTAEMVVPGEGEAVVSENLAERLKLEPGDFVVVKIPKEGFAPANAPFVSEKAETSGLRLKIKAIANERNGGRFSLGNNQSAPFNLFVSEKLLARRMGMPGFTNTLLVAGSPSLNADRLNEVLQKLMQPADAGLLFTNPEPGITQLTSGRIFIEDTLASAIRNSVPEARGVLTYLVNEISFGDHATPYSFVSATDSGIMPVDPKPGRMVINNWLADDLGVKPGDSVTLRYWVMGANRSLREASSGFRIEAVVPIANSESFRALMPDFPGMKNTGNCRDWETGTPVNLEKIRDKDETYWNDYKGTPKAWISLADGQRLWKNPFGSHTAFRFSANPGEKSLQNMIREINPAALGLSFTPVFQDGLMAAANSTDFGELFLSLGGLIVIAGLLLSGMLFALFLNHRIEEIALFRALGFKNRTILTIFFMETMLVSAIGSFAGVLAAIGYARLIVSALNTLWQDAVNTSSLFVHVDGATLFTGFLSGVILNLILFAYILYRNRNKTLPSPYRLPALYKPHRQGGRKIIRLLIPVLIFSSAVALMFVEILSGRFYPSTTFMLSGVLILAGLIFGIAFFFSGRRNVMLTADSGFLDHSLKNVVLNRTRTITAIVLLALGTFTILVTGLNRKTGGDADSKRESGTGGFQLWMSSTIPLTGDLNTADGKKSLGLEDENLPADIRFVALPGVAGDDASCLNLNQVAVPGLLGVPSALFGQRRSFTFVNLVAGIDPENPWKALETIGSPDCINGYADQTVITWGLRKKVGDTLRYTDEQGRILKIRLVGGIVNSVFQGKILVSDTLLRSFFPSTTKVSNTLIDLPKEDTEAVVQALESRLRDQGVVVTTTSAMLATFGAVENTYLDVFIMLGGFGLLIGTAGLAAMILRSLRDRKKELRLYWSLGFPKKLTYRMLAAEFLLILLSGTFIGVVAALAGTMPSWIRTGIPALPLIIIGLVMIHGMLWIHLMVKKTLRLSENS